MRFFFTLFLLFTTPAFAADSPHLRFPLECTLGESCWLMNLADTEPEKDIFKDFRCAGQTYDGHDGTDIAIRDAAAMREHVSVVAAQAGTVTRLRDTEPDKFSSLAEQDEIRTARKECGNGLIIDHGNDWTTQYCHLKQGGFKVKQGDTVKAGQPVAEVGLSGITDHPHLHLTVRHKGEVIDPFTGADIKTGCGKLSSKILAPSWGERVSFDGLNLYDGGFTAIAPDFGKISEGEKPSEPDFISKKLVFWFAYFAAREGDRVSLQIIAPSGQVIAEHQVTQDKNRARQYYFTGKETPSGLPQKGLYKGEARVTRINERGETSTDTLIRTLEIK